jgi:hypothetical protein
MHPPTVAHRGLLPRCSSDTQEGPPKGSGSVLTAQRSTFVKRTSVQTPLTSGTKSGGDKCPWTQRKCWSRSQASLSCQTPSEWGCHTGIPFTSLLEHRPLHKLPTMDHSPFLLGLGPLALIRAGSRLPPLLISIPRPSAPSLPGDPVLRCPPLEARLSQTHH